MTDDVDNTALRIATLSLLVAMLDPAGPPLREEYEAVLRELDPVTTEDGRTYIDAGKLRSILNEAVAEARNLVPEQPPAAEAEIDEGFAEITERGDELTH